MWFLLSSLTCLAWYFPPGEKSGSFLVTSYLQPGNVIDRKVEPYTPREGDLVFYDDHSETWKFLYNMVGTDVPNHSGIVIQLPDGRLALLESGPDNGTRVCLLEVLPRLHAFQGTIWVRRIKVNLSKEQSQRLTDFALAQEGKRYATLRLLAQGTPFRARGPWRSRSAARTYLNRSSWLCSELVIAAATVAGLMDPNVIPANATYPRDFMDDHRYDLNHFWQAPGTWTASPQDADR